MAVSSDPACDVPATIGLAVADAGLGAALAFSLETEGYRVVRAESLAQLLAIAAGPACMILDQDFGGAAALETTLTAGLAVQPNGPWIVMADRETAPLAELQRRERVWIVEKPLLGDRLFSVLRSVLTSRDGA